MNTLKLVLPEHCDDMFLAEAFGGVGCGQNDRFFGCIELFTEEREGSITHAHFYMPREEAVEFWRTHPKISIMFNTCPQLKTVSFSTN